jgi:hypothetical protein
MTMPPGCSRSSVPLGKMPLACIVSMDAVMLVSSPHFQRWLAAIKWQQTRSFATVQDSSTLQYRVIADGWTSSSMSHQQSTILTALAAYDSTFTQLWADCVLIHSDLIWTSPPPAHLFHQAPIPVRPNPPRHAPAPSPPVPSSRSNPRGAAGKRQRTDLPPADFTASAGIFDLAAPVPADQWLLNYVFDAMSPHTSFPKLTDTDGKIDCLICFRSALPPPNNQCHTASCISSKRKKQSGDSRQLHIDLHSEPWRSQLETYWKPVVDFLLLPGVDAVLKPAAAFKQLTPAAPWP